MKDRAQRLMGAMALMYFGPLLAGLDNHGFAVVPAFAAIFVVWLIVLEPRRFPRNLKDWKIRQTQLTVVSRSALQVLLVLVLFGIGRGIGGAAGVVVDIPVALPLAMSFLAIPLARLIHDSFAKSELPLSAEARRGFAIGMLKPLENLPEDVADRELADHLEVLGQHVERPLIEEILAEKAEEGTASAVARRALALLQSGAAAGGQTSAA
ncbi:MAG: hypothetical protein ACK4RN_12825 [Pseudorhodobacter sp.]